MKRPIIVPSMTPGTHQGAKVELWEADVIDHGRASLASWSHTMSGFRANMTAFPMTKPAANLLNGVFRPMTYIPYSMGDRPDMFFSSSRMEEKMNEAQASQSRNGLLRTELQNRSFGNEVIVPVFDRPRPKVTEFPMGVDAELIPTIVPLLNGAFYARLGKLKTRKSECTDEYGESYQSY